jgi:hypothetical protein
MKLGQRVFIVLTIDQQQGSYQGHVRGPKSFSLPAAGGPLRFSEIQLPLENRQTSRAAIDGNHLHLVIDDPAHPGDPDEYDLTLNGADHALLQIAGLPVSPFPFTRNRGPEAPTAAEDWDSQRIYALEDVPTKPNLEMARIYDEDQKVRQDFASLTPADWATIEKADALRRERTRALLSKSALQTGDDFRKAAFVFQHGDRPDDYLLAHTLALVAMAKGDQGAAWIASATLDRYLQSINQPQIYGTQFLNGATQGAYNRELISDGLRTELGVPVIQAQLQQLKEMVK